MQDVLRNYQQAAIQQLYAAWRNGSEKTLLQLPCGAGKTTIAAFLAKRLEKDGRKTLFVSHRLELCSQAHGRFAEHGIDAGLVLPGFSPNGHKTIVASVQSLVRREMPNVDLLIIDECHRAMSPVFKKVIASHVGSGKRVLGLTATVERLDRQPLGRIFDKLVSPVTIDELIAKKYLVPLRYYAAHEKGLTDKVKMIGGDYNASTMFDRMNKKYLYDNVVEKYKRFSGGKALVFCCNVAHSQATAKAFVDAGIRAQHLDGDTSIQERIKIVKEFRRGQFDVLTNCNLFGEGFDLPDLHAVVLNRATASKCLYTQMVGRALRTSPGKEYGVVIDMGNNIEAHGFVEDLQEQEHDIFSEPRRGDSVAPMKDCPRCGSMMYASARVCKDCGFIFPIAEMELKEAEFVEVKRKPVPIHLRKRWSQMTKAELEEYAEFRGYKPGWVYFQMKLRKEHLRQGSPAMP